MTKNKSGLNSLFTLIFIALPSLIIFYFLLPTWANKQVVSHREMWLIAFGFCLYSFLLNFLLIYFKILSIESLNFNIPMTFSLMALFVGYKLPFWIMFLIILGIIMFALPINIITNKYRHQKLNKKN